MEDIILKIKKLLALSKSSNEHEAQNAMIMAQKLLAKHKLSMKYVEDFNTSKVEGIATGAKFRGKSWKNNLAQVIANNFGCYVYVQTYYSKEICFLGKEEDITICNIMLTYAIKCITQNSDRIIKMLKKDKRRKNFKTIKNDYALGFICGLNQRFEEQIKKNKEWGLVLTKDKEVIEKFEEFKKGAKEVKCFSRFDKNVAVYNRGVRDGKEFDISNKIENDETEIKELA